MLEDVHNCDLAQNFKIAMLLLDSWGRGDELRNDSDFRKVFQTQACRCRRKCTLDDECVIFMDLSSMSAVRLWNTTPMPHTSLQTSTIWSHSCHGSTVGSLATPSLRLHLGHAVVSVSWCTSGHMLGIIAGSSRNFGCARPGCLVLGCLLRVQS